MSNALSRRRLVRGGLTAAAGASGVAIATRLAEQYGLIPPDHGGIYGAGETLTYAAQRLFMSRHSLAREDSIAARFQECSLVNGDPPSERNLPTAARERFPRTGVSRWIRPGGASVCLLARGPAWLSFAQSDHPSSLRGRVVLHRRMDRRASFLCTEPGGSPAARRRSTWCFFLLMNRGTVWTCPMRGIRKLCWPML